MRNPGTDVLALACIVGGGVIAGGVTLALASDSEVPSLECATTVGSDADVVVSLGGEGLVVVTPDVRVREVRECMQDVGFHHMRVEMTQALQHEQHELQREMSRVERDVEREVEEARREADRVRREVDRIRDRVRRVDVQRIDGDQERRQERAERARERVERALERAERHAEVRVRDGEHVSERMEERAREAFELAQGLHLDGVEAEALGEMMRFQDGFQIALPNQTFEFSFEGLEDMDLAFEGLEEALAVQLQVLEGMDLELEGLDEGLEEEIEQRLEEKMRELEERLKRIRENGGR